MADLFEKKRATSFGGSFVRDAEPEKSGSVLPLGELHQNDPLSPHFQHGVKNRRDLLRYLTAMQVRRYGRVVDLSGKIMTRHVRIYVDTYTLDALARGICYAAQVCEHPFSLAFVVNQILPQLRDRCPFLTLMNTNEANASGFRKRRNG